MLSKQAVLDSLTMLRLAGLKTYGTWPVDDDELDAKVRVYQMALDEDVEALDLQLATQHFVRKGGEFPDAGRFAQKCRENHDKRHVRVAQTLPDGRVALQVVLVSEAPELPGPGDDPEALESAKAKYRAALGKLATKDHDRDIRAREATEAERRRQVSALGDGKG